MGESGHSDGSAGNHAEVPIRRENGTISGFAGLLDEALEIEEVVRSGVGKQAERLQPRGSGAAGNGNRNRISPGERREYLGAGAEACLPQQARLD